MREPPRRFGPEYPRFLVDSDGVRLSLQREHRWSRIYRHPNKNAVHQISRFMDGSATITFDELQAEWSTWSRNDRLDFCANAAWLHGQRDFEEILRFVVREGDSDMWSAVGISVAAVIPQDEAFRLLLPCLAAADLAHTSNLVQAIARTRHPSARATLQDHFDRIAAHPGLLADDKFMNWLAFTAICTIQYLLELGADPQAFDSTVRVLSEHPCRACRESCSRFLGAKYPWLPPVVARSDGPG
jgi:hypothetical protein